jgi:hypothetical protein
MAGAALAAEEDVVAEARIWQRRHGGNLVTQHPFVVAAERALDERLGRLPAHLDHARALAAELATVDGLEVVPDPPQTPLFHLLMRGDHDRLADAALSVAEERKVFLFADPSSTTSPSWQRHEVMVGEVTLELGPEELRELYVEVLERAGGQRGGARRREAPVSPRSPPRLRPRARERTARRPASRPPARTVSGLTSPGIGTSPAPSSTERAA